MLAVLGALFANGVIALMKLAAALVTGSSGMMAEAFHSFADTVNQVFLLLGLRFYKRPASEKHPFGHGKERFFWSFIAAIFIFGVGATYATYEGIVKLSHPHPPERVGWAYAVLAVSFLLEGGSISLAIYQEVKEAHSEGLSVLQYLRQSKDPTAKTVLFEDSAALLGILIAAGGLYLTEMHVGPGGGAFWDGVASITIGLVLAVVAFVLARTSRALLLGEAASPEEVQAITRAIESHPNVVKVVELLTMHLAPKEILINAHVKLRDGLTTEAIEKTIEEIEELIRRTEPKVEKIFLETARETNRSDRELVSEHVG
ncbi:MAG TPA: cation diffusion facilitator family transporter [Pyrinomonadaceae bacterium]|nr:cation diffusion facilitator family transporter [Pyrinomonadaceae bacterium]